MDLAAKRLALPRALHHFYMGRPWHAFVEALGFTVDADVPTDRGILDEGVAGSLADLCLPVKAYMGHAGRAVKKGVPLLVPRLVSLDRSRYYCPKFLALPDMVRARFPEAEILVVEVNAKKGPGFTSRSYASLARALGAGGRSAAVAVAKMESEILREREEGARRWKEWTDYPPGAPRIAVVGHPYVVGDDYVSSGVRAWLESQGASVATCEMVPDDLIESADPALIRDVYWEGARSQFRGAVHFLARDDLDGMIFLSAFGCGPDSFLSDMIGRRVRKSGAVPFARLLVDEHTAREGLVTRLEAFMDMVEAFRAKRRPAR